MATAAPSTPPPMDPATPTNHGVLLESAPATALIERTRNELASDFDFSRPVRISRAPARLDVMGGIADYTGSLVCEMTLDRAAVVALQPRTDRQLQVFSFNLYDEHRPFTFRIPLDALAREPATSLRREFNEPGRLWAGYLAGCLFVLNQRGLINLADPALRGVNLAVLSDVPIGAGLSSSAAITVATMMNLRDHFGLLNPSAGKSLRISNETAMNPLLLAQLCQQVEHQIVGAPCGIMDPATSCWGQTGSLLRMVCQPHELLPALAVPPGVRLVGINSGVRHRVGGGAYARTRCAAFMAHRIILEKMRQIGAAAGRRLVRDPMDGYLANLNPDDYKKMFRPALPQTIRGDAFLGQYGGTADSATTVEPDVEYAIVHAADHHVLEARRVKNFAKFLEEAAGCSDPARRGLALDKAGHLMYASHQSYGHDAMLGCQACDLLVKLLRDRERAGLYGARITGGGSGGTVALLADDTDRAAQAIDEAMRQYAEQAARQPELLAGSSPGAWHLGTALAGASITR